MKTLLPSLGTSFWVGQFSPILQKCSINGWPIVGDGSGKVGILDSKALEYNMDKGPIVGDGSDKVGADNKVVGQGGGMANLMKMTRFLAGQCQIGQGWQGCGVGQWLNVCGGRQ
jgi:hypothetical protein